MLKKGEIRESMSNVKENSKNKNEGKSKTKKKRFYEPEDEEANLEAEIEGEKKLTYPLRQFKNGHIGSPITAVFMDKKRFVLYTGAENGTVCEWNMKESKMKYLYYDTPIDNIDSVPVEKSRG